MKDKPTTFWYMEPLDTHTNEMFAQNIPGNDTCPQKMCGDGVRRDLWRCSRKELHRFDEDRNEKGLSFQSYSQNGPHGQIRPYTPAAERVKRKHDMAA